PGAIWMPPAFASSPSPNGNVLGTDATTTELLSSTELSSMVSGPPSTMPPPSVKAPFGGLTAATLPVTEQGRRDSVPAELLLMPPPSALLASEWLDGVDPAVLSVTSTWSSVSAPAFAMPPPNTKAQSCGVCLHENPPDGIVSPASTRLPVTTLLLIVTV